jgi:hypothetical protein
VPRLWPRREAAVRDALGSLYRFDPHQRPRPAVRHIWLGYQEEVAMPIDSILVSAAVVSLFVVFAGVLIWGDFRSRPMRQQPVARNRKHRSF